MIVNIDAFKKNENLFNQVSDKAISEMDQIGKTKISKETVKLNIQKSGVDYTSQGARFEETDTQVLIPDIVGILAKNCKLTRDTMDKFY